MSVRDKSIRTEIAIPFNKDKGVESIPFVAVLANLSQWFQVTVPSKGKDQKTPSANVSIVPAPSGNGLSPQAQCPPIESSSIKPQFVVTLTFRERATKPLLQRVEPALKLLLDSLEAMATRLIAAPGGATAYSLVSLLDSFLSQDPSSPKLAEFVKALWPNGPGSTIPGFAKFEPLLRKLGENGLPNLRLNQLTPEEWNDFLQKIQHNAPAPPASSSAPPSTTQPASAAPSYELTQLFGWLNTNGTPIDNPCSIDMGPDGTLLNKAYVYEIRIGGTVRFAPEAAEYADGARLDIFGPDGSQLLTKLLDVATLAGLLDTDPENTGVSPICVDSSTDTDLVRALERINHSEARKLVTVKGRLWFSDGRAFEKRQLAIFSPPAFPQPVDDCCDDDGLFQDLSESCCGDSSTEAVIKVPYALAVTQTDDSGYFTFDYELKPELFVRHFDYALLHIQGVRNPLAVKVHKLEERDETPGCPFPWRFPDPLLLEVDSHSIDDSGCDCKKTRWIEQDSEDNKKCAVNGFGEPNQTLDQFDFNLVVRTTDPFITRRSLKSIDCDSSYPISRTPDIGGFPDDLFRLVLDRNNPIMWDDLPTIAEATTISHGRVLTIRQTWRADGYSMGDLLYSLPLAPLQKKNIAVIDWDRSDFLIRDEQRTNVDMLQNVVSRDRDISEIVNSALNEFSRGRSEAGNSASSSGSGIFGAIFGSSSGGSSMAWSTSSQDSSRNLAASFLNQLRDRTAQAASSFRSQRITTVQQVNQSEHSRAVTETVANRNACHAITIQYFEVLRHFKIEYQLAAVRECLFIPMPIEPFDKAKVMRWRDTIRSYLPTNQLRRGLVSLEGIDTDNYPAARYCDEPLNSLYGYLNLIMDFAVPAIPIKKDDPQSDDYISKYYTLLSTVPDAVMSLKNVDENQKQDYFRNVISPLLAQKFIAGLQFNVVTEGSGVNGVNLPITASLSGGYKAGTVATITLAVDKASIPQGLNRASIKYVNVTYRGLTSEGLASLVPSYGTLSVCRISLNYVSDHVDRQLLDNAYGGNGVSLPLKLGTPLHSDELRDPGKESKKELCNLINHLNEHVEFYHKAIWWEMDPDRRYRLLDGYIAPHSGGRSVASVVENRLVGIIGNALVMPVAPGIRLDYYTDVDAPAKDSDEIDKLRGKIGDRNNDPQDALLTAYKPFVAAPSIRVSIPTKGVYAESVMGKCNSCEKMDDSRNWRYWEHPLPDQPTAIEPISTAS